MGTVALGSGQPRPCGVRARDARSLVCVFFFFFLTTAAGDAGFVLFSFLSFFVLLLLF